MTTAWVVVAVLFAGTAILRAAGPVAFGTRSLSGRGAAVVGLVAPALLGALVVYETVSTGGQGIELDARLVGLAAAGLALDELGEPLDGEQPAVAASGLGQAVGVEQHHVARLEGFLAHDWLAIGEPQAHRRRRRAARRRHRPPARVAS